MAAPAVLAPFANAADPKRPEPRPQVELPYGSDYGVARDLVAKQKWTEAAIVLRSVLKRSPDYTPAILDLSRALAFSGRREEAIGILIQAAERSKSSPKKDVLSRRAKVLSRLFMTNATFQAYHDGVNLIVEQKYGAAREKLDKALELEPDNAEILTRLGQALVLDQDYDSAVERLRLARRLNPYDPQIRLWLGKAMYHRGELTEAVDELKVAYPQLKSLEMAEIWFAEALSTLGHRNAAIQVLERAVKNYPMHLKTMITLAKLRMQAAPSKDTQVLWSARKDLQAALSRVSQLESSNPPKTVKVQDDLGLTMPVVPSELKAEAQKMLQQVDNRLGESSA